MAQDKEQKMAFAVQMTDDVPLMTIGVPQAAWDYMKDGKTHTFDLTPMGVPLKLMIFGGESHDAVTKTLFEAASKAGIVVNDMRRTDFSIKDIPKGGGT